MARTSVAGPPGFWGPGEAAHAVGAVGNDGGGGVPGVVEIEGVAAGQVPCFLRNIDHICYLILYEL